MASTLEQPRAAIIKGFCFQDSLHDSLLYDADALKRRKLRLGKPDPLPERREPWKGLRDEELRAQIYAKVESLSGQPLAALWAQLNVQPKDAEPAPQADAKPLIPTEPPGGQLYEKRSDKRQSAPDYILSVYEGFLNGTFTRADLRRIDPKAEMALRNWERANGRAPLKLPTIKERNDEIVAAGLIATDDPIETARRAAAAVNRSKKNTQPI